MRSPLLAAPSSKPWILVSLILFGVASWALVTLKRTAEELETERIEKQILMKYNEDIWTANKYLLDMNQELANQLTETPAKRKIWY